MEDPRDQQRPPAGQVVYPPQYAVSQPPYPYYQPAPAPRVGAAGKLARVLRLLLRRILYNLVLLGRALRPVAGAVIVGLVAISVIGWLSWQLWGPKPGAPDIGRVESLPQAPAVQSYLQGRKSFDAERMWEAYSSDYQAEQMSRGASKATLQSQANIEKQRGFQYGAMEYIGGIPLDDGGSMYFYSVTISVQSQKVKVPLIIWTDRAGKIANMIDPLDRTNSSR
ncbi:MAG TPA: hypothetical protein VNL77_06775 [Roseiflexaceae bacterium]|nr:hypothetical protein [Roseiflexaceae bacterium]